MTQYTCARHRGFTLMEMVVALLLLSIVSMAISSLNGNLFFSRTDMRGMQQGTQLLQACIDQVLAQRKSSGYGATFHCDELNALNTGSTLAVTLQATPDYCPSGLECKQVQITMTPAGGSSTKPASLLFVNY